MKQVRRFGLVRMLALALALLLLVNQPVAVFANEVTPDDTSPGETGTAAVAEDYGISTFAYGCFASA